MGSARLISGRSATGSPPGRRLDVTPMSRRRSRQSVTTGAADIEKVLDSLAALGILAGYEAGGARRWRLTRATV